MIFQQRAVPADVFRYISKHTLFMESQTQVSQWKKAESRLAIQAEHLFLCDALTAVHKT